MTWSAASKMVLSLCKRGDSIKRVQLVFISNEL